jgi:hypothetical protein
LKPIIPAHSRADIGRAVNGIKSAGIGIAVVKRKFFNNNHLNARGDLNPILGVYFPLFSMVLPWEFPSG